VYAPDVLKKMESYLAYAERHVDTPKRKKRLALVRAEFDYAKNLGQIGTLYAAFTAAPSKGTLDPLLDQLEARERMLDRICGTGGATAAIEGWPEIGPFRRICRERDILEKNGKSLARLGAPIGWNVKKIRESGVVPGEKTKTSQAPRVSGKPSNAKE